MIKFEVTGETWKDILVKLEGLIPIVSDKSTHPIEPKEEVTETTEEPEKIFTPAEKTGWTSPEEIISIDEELVKIPDATPISLPGANLDTAKKPWDKAIHARTKALNEDGTWKTKRKTPGFPKKTGPAHAVTTPPALPPAIAPSTAPTNLQEFTAYSQKIVASGRTFQEIVKYLANISIPNVMSIPVEKFPEVAESLKIQFGVDY